jgi:hypothetical protein
MNVIKLTTIAVCATVAAGVSLAPQSARASTITVENSSFETPPAGFPQYTVDGQAFSYSQIPGWTSLPATDTPGGSDYGQLQPAASGIFVSVPDGRTIAFADFGATISQTVGEVAVAGTTYTLQVDVGQRADQYQGACCALVDLIVNGVVHAATGALPGPGLFSTWTAVYTATLLDAGGAITIRLSDTVQQGDFDKVRLSGVPGEAGPGATPLPAALPLFATGLGALGLVGWRRKRKSANSARVSA